MRTETEALIIEPLGPVFSVCKVADYTGADLDAPFIFTGCTDGEKSLVCPADRVPGNALAREDGWKAFRIRGELSFDLVGILAGISGVLASAGIGIFAVSTFNTDYIFTKEADFDPALSALEGAGYRIMPGN